MGNWHCVPNGCARVVYREYFKPIRYRYPGEDWQYVDGDDWDIDEQQGQCYTGYRVTFDVTIREYWIKYDLDTSGNPASDWYIAETNDVDKTWSLTTFAGLKAPDLPYGYNPRPVKIKSLFSNNLIVLSSWEGAGTIRLRGYYPVGTYIEFNTIRSHYAPTENKFSWRFLHETIRNVQYESLVPEPEDCEKDCTLTITKNGKIVHQETRSECPEVEQESECKLSDTYKEIKIEKVGYLERVEVVDKYYQVHYGGFTPSDNVGLIVIAQDIPDRCLNIYKLNTTTIVPTDSSSVNLNNSSQTEFESGLIEQICSAPGCPPPEYTVYCDCDCESCPDGTCAIVCDDHVCCNDKATGKFVQQIPIENYCGEGN